MSLAFLNNCKPIWRTQSRQCKSCQTVKPLDDFYGQVRAKEGKRNICKACWNKGRGRG